MSDSIRKANLQNIVTTLTAISETNSYNNTIDSSHVHRVQTVGIAAVEYPTLNVLVPRETKVNEVTNAMTMEMEVMVEIWVRSGDGELLADVLEDMITDVQTAIMSTPTRGGNAIDTSYVGTKISSLDELEEPKARAEVTFMVLYRTRREDPSLGG